ncbi:MAG: M90 family metallopeptidase [Pseudomonadota bacterium]
MIRRLREWLRRRNAARIAVTAEQWAHAEMRLPFLGHLSNQERIRLRELALQFLAEKQMSGARGLELNALIQLSIALQACLLVLNLGLDWYRGWVGIVIYPGDFVIPRQQVDEHGILHEFDDAVLGEAWQGGPVILSWFGERQETDGINVVIHEFAHKLDMGNGAPDGLPPLRPGMSRDAWINAFAPAYENFCGRVDQSELDGVETALDPYAAESPAEFFAVMSEAFFETPQLLREEYPAVYAQLKLFYRQDPLATPTDID